MSEILVESNSSASEVGVHRVEDPSEAEDLARLTSEDEQAVVYHNRMAKLQYPYPEAAHSTQAAQEARKRADERADRAVEVYARTKAQLDKDASSPVSWASSGETEPEIEPRTVTPNTVRRMARRVLNR